MKKALVLIVFLVLTCSAQQVDKAIKTPDMPEIHKWKIQALNNKYISLQEQEKRMSIEHQALMAQIAQAAKDVNAELDATYKDTEVDKANWDINGDGQFVPKAKKPDSK